MSDTQEIITADDLEVEVTETATEPQPAHVVEWEHWLETLKAQIGEAAIENADRAAAAKSAKKNMDELIEEYASAKCRGPQQPPEPDPQAALPLAFDAFSVSVDDLDVGTKLLKDLHGADYDTIGKLQAKMQVAPTEWFTDIKGIGRSQATLVEEAVNVWLENNTPIEKEDDPQQPFRDEVADEFRKRGILAEENATLPAKIRGPKNARKK